ncbi:hypothetical protein QE152_g13770 [Popillia japonica]|uniref:Uncharacterized protein n=1 Tax=Popillia japonica TaxID=7064 RepID=A0AAW1LBQ6_POPJA
MRHLGRLTPPYNPDMSQKVDIVKQLFSTEKRTRQRGRCQVVEVSLFKKQELTSAVKKKAERQMPSCRTLYKLTKIVYFKYLNVIVKRLLEGNDIIYLQYRNIEGHTRAHVWVDVNVTTRRQAFIDDVSTDLKHPAGKGRR